MSSTALDEVEFLVASESCIYKISQSCIEKNLSSAWIGERDAFSAYQQYYHEANNSLTPGLEHSAYQYPAIPTGMRDAFEAVIKDSRFPSVSGFLITTVSNSSQGQGFHYLPSSEGFDFQPVSNTSEETSLLIPKDASNGGYNYSILSPERVGVGIIGIHFLQGQLGAVLHPLASSDALFFRGVNAQEFISDANSELGIRLSGIFWSF